MTEFEKCVDIVIDLEGGDDIVSDSGGMTRYGISSRAHPSVDVKNLTRSQAEVIYHDEYWEECSCDGYAWPLNLVIFDAAVNQGPGYAKTLAFSALDYVEALLMRVDRYAELVNRNKALAPYLHGWINRVVRIYRMVQA